MALLRAPRASRPIDPGELRTLPLPDGRRVILGDPSEVIGSGWQRKLAWLVLVAAAGVDVGTFYQVIVLVMNLQPEVVWGVVVGFTAVALTLAHYVGTHFRDAIRPGGDNGARQAGWACFAVWLTLGIVAFVVRWVISEESGGSVPTIEVVGQPPISGLTDAQTTAQHLGALLFAVLYAGSGTVAALAGLYQPHPAARRYRRAMRKRSAANARFAAVEKELTAAVELRTAVARERDRRQAALEGAKAQCDAAASRLKQEARLIMHGMRPPPPSENEGERSS